MRLKAAAGLASASHAFAHKSAVKSQQWVTSFEAEDRHAAMRRDAEKSTAVSERKNSCCHILCVSVGVACFLSPFLSLSFAGVEFLYLIF